MKVSVPNTVAAGAIAIGTFLSPNGQDPIGIGYRIYSDASQKPVQEEVFSMNEDDPINRTFIEMSEEINSNGKCSNLDAFMNGWRTYTEEHVRLMEELNEEFGPYTTDSTIKQEKKVSSSQYLKEQLYDRQDLEQPRLSEEVFEAACRRAQNTYGRKEVAENPDGRWTYQTLPDWLRNIIDFKTYSFLDPQLQKRLHEIEYYDELTKGDHEKIKAVRREFRPQNLVAFENAQEVQRIREESRRREMSESEGNVSYDVSYDESEFDESEFDEEAEEYKYRDELDMTNPVPNTTTLDDMMNYAPKPKPKAHL